MRKKINKEQHENKYSNIMKSNIVNTFMRICLSHIERIIESKLIILTNLDKNLISHFILFLLRNKSKKKFTIDTTRFMNGGVRKTYVNHFRN